MKFALVHEWLTPHATGGSELVVREILQAIEADLFAAIDFESTNPESYLHGRRIGTTFLQHLPRARRGLEIYLPLMPLAIEQLDLHDYDVVLSSSHAVAKGVLVPPGRPHLCYCHTPMRYAWDLTFDYLAGMSPPARLAARLLFHGLRQWDALSAQRVDFFAANSAHTARRIWRCYRRRAEVIYPPVPLDRVTFRERKEDFYLCICRLVTYKKVAAIVAAFNQLGRPLVVIGGGPLLAKIRRLARPNVRVMGRQPDGVVRETLARAKAFVYAACEDFGIVMVEALACGTPVIACRQGGAAEIVRDLREDPREGTGLLFEGQTPEAIAAAVGEFDRLGQDFRPERARARAETFSPEVFRQRYRGWVEGSIASFRGQIAEIAQKKR